MHICDNWYVLDNKVKINGASGRFYYTQVCRYFADKRIPAVFRNIHNNLALEPILSHFETLP
jgi:hypothetical protein